MTLTSGRVRGCSLNHSPDCPQPAIEQRELVETRGADQGDRAGVGALNAGVAILLLGSGNQRSGRMDSRLHSACREDGAEVFRWSDELRLRHGVPLHILYSAGAKPNRTESYDSM